MKVNGLIRLDEKITSAQAIEYDLYKKNVEDYN